MAERQSKLNRSRVAGVMVAATLAASVLSVTAHAWATFTWDPAGASPALSGAGSSFTANGIVGLHYLYDDTPPAGSPALYNVYFIEQITEFTLDGKRVATPGLDGLAGAPGSYGLYLSMQAVAQQSGATRIYHSLELSLMADPGNNDGAVSSTVAGH